MNLRGRRIHIVGSADQEAEVTKLEYVHALVSELTVALAAKGAIFDRLEQDGRPPEEAMKAFRFWVETAAADHEAVFVGFNACYDWQFVNWYFESFAGGNPFGFGGIDIKSYYMGFSGLPWSKTTSSQLPPDFQPDSPQTHNALDDARAQASIFQKLLLKAETKRS